MAVCPRCGGGADRVYAYYISPDRLVARCQCGLETEGCDLPDALSKWEVRREPTYVGKCAKCGRGFLFSKPLTGIWVCSECMRVDLG